jgi:4-oxalocrotonate tautomerase
MPVIEVHLRAGRSAEDKRQLIEAITEVVTRVLGSKRERVVVLLEEVDPQSWGQGGTVLADELRQAEEL